MLQKPFSAHLTELRRELHWLPIKQRIQNCCDYLQGEALWSTGLLTRSSSRLPANNKDSAPTSCSVLHLSVRSLTDYSRLQHRPFGTLYRHHYDQLDSLTLLVFLDLDLKPICSRQHISPRTVQRCRSAPDSLATSVL